MGQEMHRRREIPILFSGIVTNQLFTYTYDYTWC